MATGKPNDPLGSLARLGVLATDLPLLEESLGLVQIEGVLVFTGPIDRINRAAYVLGLLYSSDPEPSRQPWPASSKRVTGLPCLA
jgi:hypothetical protein